MVKLVTLALALFLVLPALAQYEVPIASEEGIQEKPAVYANFLLWQDDKRL